EADIERSDCYFTNAVKHFKHEMRGKRRIHKRPNSYEIDRCRWWLDHEIALLQPKLIVALGGTAVGALLKRAGSITKLRGAIRDFSGYPGWVTVHPSYLLRIPDRTRSKEEFHRFVSDLRGAFEAASRI